MNLMGTNTLASAGMRILIEETIQAYGDVWVDCKDARIGFSLVWRGSLLSVVELNDVWTESLELVEPMGPSKAYLGGVLALLDQIAAKLEQGLQARLPGHMVACQDLGMSVSQRLLNCPAHIQATFSALAAFESLLNGYKVTTRLPQMTYSNSVQIPNLLTVVSAGLPSLEHSRVWTA